MWPHVDKNFSTPPPTWRKQRSLPSPLSERKRISTPENNKKGDIFHVIHKVPSGDSPYVRAKHIQLIDKDPSRAVSLFWAAINAGDRVDSALKDMAVVMKQLDRSDEAIEAVKSFRHLCPYDSQESLDNVLIELYKRSGRIEEEIELLQNKLKNIEEGIAFAGATTKMARSQGKKIQITIEQEKSRILGNLAWAYMQQNNFEMAEQYYRKALSLGVDMNKQCNLAICLMHMNRVTEAKSLLQAVKISAGNRQMDTSYSRSFERAIQMLTELESPSVLKLTELEVGDDQKNQRPFALPADGNTNPQVTCSTSGGQNHHLSTFSVCCRSLANGHDEEILNEQDRIAYSRNHHENKHSFLGYDKGSLKLMSSGPRAASQFSLPMFVDNRRRGSYIGNPHGKSGLASTMKKNCGSSPGIGVSSAHQEAHVSPAAVRRNLEVLFTQPRRPFREFSDGEQGKDRWGPIGSSNINQSSEKTLHTYSTVLFTQPRRSSSREHNMEDQRVARCREKPVGSSIRKLTFEQAIPTENDQAQAIPCVKRKLVVPTKDESKIGLPNSKNALPSPNCEDWTRRSWKDNDQVKDEPVKQPLRTAADRDLKSTCWKTDGFALTKHMVMESGSEYILDEMQKMMNTCGNGDDQQKLAMEGSNSATTLPTGPSMAVDNTVEGLITSIGNQSIDNNSDILQQSIAEKTKSSLDCIATKDKKSWADMVEEEENEEQDENLNSNIVYPSSCAQNQIDYLSQKLEDSFDLKDGHAASRNAALPSKNLKARRSLCFDQQLSPEPKVHFYSSPLPNKGLKFDNSVPGTMRVNRLQVFRDITPFPDSP